MGLTLDKKNQKLVFSGEFSVVNIKPVTEMLKNNIDTLQQWERISIELGEVEKADTAFLQVIFSLRKTFPRKFRIVSFSAEMEEKFRLCGFRLEREEKGAMSNGKNSE
jgi:anti-anti-sigma regulatory factor